ncbi:hypothetical protein [uncultured Streptomyces sp.]|uniref:hypothetical protein n=1 Tax=uncultured Streptomyces sp. TaxID=174707 RepID=UPI00261A383E|nr:hypothetical protein [uncultured Streptomyces sp.]
MTTGETPGRSMARAHLSQLIELFGADGRLVVDTAHEPDRTGAAPGGDDEPQDGERT